MTKSRNKREGWYAGWKPHYAYEGHRRSGPQSQDVDWVPCPDPLNHRIVRRYCEPINVVLV